MRYAIDIAGYQQVITFDADNPRVLVPSREYLELHAACAKVAHVRLETRDCETAEAALGRLEVVQNRSSGYKRRG